MSMTGREGQVCQELAALQRKERDSVTTQTSNGAVVPATAGADLATLAERINREHRAAEVALNTGLEHALEAGRLLIEAKAQVAHGEWLPWLERHFEGAPRTARVYVQLARRWPQIKEAKRQRVANLSVRSAVKLLASPTDGARATPQAEQRPFWSIREMNDRQVKRISIECSIGQVLAWAESQKAPRVNKLWPWLCPAEGWMNEERALSLIVSLVWDAQPGRGHELWEEVCTYYNQITPDFASFPVVCMCDLAIAMHKFMRQAARGGATPDGKVRGLAAGVRVRLLLEQTGRGSQRAAGGRA